MESNGYAKRLIEYNLPIKALSALASSEKSARHGHLSTLHIWWARRPLAACRAVILAALLPDPGDPHCPQYFRAQAPQILNRWRQHVRLSPITEDTEQLRDSLYKFIEYASAWKNSTQPIVLDTCRGLLKAAWPDGPPLVIDPFSGGGSIPLEAARVGATAFASDLNPVAILLLRTQLSDLPRYGREATSLFLDAAGWVKDQVEQDVGRFYGTSPDGGTPIAYQWARAITCEGPGCGARVPLIGQTLLASRPKGSVALGIAGENNPPRVAVKVRHGIRASEAQPGTMRHGSVTCPVCGYTTKTASIQKQMIEHKGGAANAVMTAVTCNAPGGQGKVYREPNEVDLHEVAAAADELHRRADIPRNELSIVPDEPLPPAGTLGFRTQRYGMTTWGDFYTPRQALVLTSFIEAMRRAHIEGPLRDAAPELQRVVTTLLALAIDRLAAYLSSTCLWVNKGEFVGQVFSQGNALPMRWDFAEVAPLANGPGNWDGAVEWIIRVADHLTESDLTPAQVERADAANLPLPDDIAAAVITDPPYYDAFAYADLSDYFYVWLKRSIGDLYPDLFGRQLTPKTEEIVANYVAKGKKGEPKDKLFFEAAMTLALEDARRVLAPNGIAVIVFAHKSTSGWEALLQAVIDAKWSVTASWPIDTERPGRLRAHNSAALASSIHLVCRPRENPDGSVRSGDVGDWRDILSELPKRIHEWMPRLASEGVVGADAIFACLGPALEIFSRYSSVEKTSGETVELREYLENVWAAVAKEALSTIFSGANASGLEEDARLTAIWFWVLKAAANGNGKAAEVPEEAVVEEDDEQEPSTGTKKLTGYLMEFDAVRKLAQGLMVDLRRLSRPGGILTIQGNMASLSNVISRERHLLGEQLTLFGNGSGPHLITQRTHQPAALLKSVDARQMSLFPEDAIVSTDPAQPHLPAFKPLDDLRPLIDKLMERGSTLLDRLHQAMLLFGRSHTALLGPFLHETGAGYDPDFWRLAQALSALYPPQSDEKRWVEGLLSKRKGLGFA